MGRPYPIPQTAKIPQTAILSQPILFFLFLSLCLRKKVQKEQDLNPRPSDQQEMMLTITPEGLDEF